MYIKREVETEIERWLEEREIIAIRGPRQSGKTTVLNKIKENLISRGITEKMIHYFNFEDDILRLKFEANCQEFIDFHRQGEHDYFLFDEVQNVKEVGKKLKLIFDSSKIKVIITGSSSFDLTNLGQYLVGRVIFIDLYPFNFLEFLRTKGEKYEQLFQKLRIDLINPKIENTIFLDELNKFLHEYLTFGAYPRVVLENDLLKKKELLRNLFKTYIEKDVVSLYGNKYRNNVVILLKTLSGMLGGIVKYETLTESSGLKYRELRELIPLLEDSFVISTIKPFHKSVVSELRKNPKIYFVDMGIRNYLLENFENVNFDSLYENFVCNELNKRYKLNYWRTTTKSEIDFVINAKEIIPIEVKTSPKISRALRSFITTYGCKTALVANLTKASQEKLDDCKLFTVPLVYF